MSVQQFTMPSGVSVWYRDADHSYWESYDEKKGTCSARVSGASTIAKCDGQTNIDGLLDWAARLTCEGVAREWADYTVEIDSGAWLDSGYALEQRLRDTKQTWRDIRNEKGDAGTAAHNVLEQLSEGVTPAFTGGHQLAVVDWWRKTRPDPIHVETVVYDHERSYAGRFDLMHNPSNPTLLDLKTGSVRESAIVQLNLYALACKVAGYTQPKRLVILDTFDNGDWREIEVPINPSWAYVAISCAQNGRDMRRALSKAKKEARRSTPEPQRVAA